MKAEHVRQIVSCKPEVLEEVASTIEVPIAIVRGARAQFMRALGSKCYICGTELAGCACPKGCPMPKKLLFGKGPFRLLKRMSPKEPLTSSVCKKCGRSFTVTVNQVLERYESRRKPRVPEFCTPACEAKHKKTSTEKKPCYEKQPLTHRPLFDQLAKLKEELGRSSKSEKLQKQTQKRG